MRRVIRLGDATSHGGKVVSVGATQFTVDGIAVARVGDVCSCPVKGHGNCLIAEGNAQHVIDGIAVAYVGHKTTGHKTTCGAEVMASASQFGGE